LIQVKVAAKNQLGWGPFSNENSIGVTIQTIPLTPTLPVTRVE